MSTLDQQYIAALERQNRLLRAVIVIALLVLVPLSLGGWQSGLQDLRVRSLRVVNDAGKEVVQLGVGANGGAINVRGLDEKNLVTLGATDQFKDGQVDVFDSKGVRRLVAGFLKASSQDNREAGFGSYDPDGKIRIVLGQSRYNYYGLKIYGSQSVQLEAGVKNDQAAIDFSSVAGRLKSRWIENGDSTIEFYNKTNLADFMIGGAGRNISRIPQTPDGSFKPTQTWP